MSKIQAKNVFKHVLIQLSPKDLLAHPNLKGFVTHAGYLSFEEALCHQIPMVVENLITWFFGRFNRKRSWLQTLKKNQVATPICYDQFANAEEIEKLGEHCLPEQNAYWTNNLHQELVGLSTSPTSQGQRYQNFWTRWTQHPPLNTIFRLWNSLSSSFVSPGSTRSSVQGQGQAGWGGPESLEGDGRACWQVFLINWCDLVYTHR